MQNDNEKERIEALGVQSITDLLGKEDAQIFTVALVEAMGADVKINVDLDQAKRLSDLTSVGVIGVSDDRKTLVEIASRAGGRDEIAPILEKHLKNSKHLEPYAEELDKLDAEFGTGNKTREAYNRMQESIRRAEAQSILTGRKLRQAKQVQKALKKMKNPNHYTTRKEIKAKQGQSVTAHKSRDHFGKGKQVIYVMGKDGTPKPITIKNAKKQGLI
jgi:hypothetical protein